MANSRKKSNKHAWFIRTRGSYLPSSWQGWLTYIPYVAYLVSVLAVVLHNKESWWLAIFTVVPNWVAALVIMQWLASRKS